MSEASGNGFFPTTQWTLVSRLRSSDKNTAMRALNDLCRQYRYPLYCYIRRRGKAHEEAEDALHDFLARLVQGDWLQGTSQERGRLRGFLSTALHRHLVSAHRAVSVREILLSGEEWGELEKRYQQEQFTNWDTPENLFDKKWSQALLSRALDQLESSYSNKGRSIVFDALRPVLLDGGSLRGHDPAALAAGINITEGNLRTSLHRLLIDYGIHVRAEVMQTVDDVSEVDNEINALLQLYNSP